MDTRSLRFLVVLMAMALVPLAACTEGAEETDEELASVVPDGKADDFLSMSAQEYRISGTFTVTIEDSYADATDEEKLARVEALIPLKHIQIGWFLNQYIVDKSSHDSNEEYGGFEALTKNGSYDELDIRAVEEGSLTYQFTFIHEIGGALDFLEEVPTTTDDDGRVHFVLKVGNVSNDKLSEILINNEWYRESPWSSFNPDGLDASKYQELDLTVEPEDRSSDAWIDYNRLFADGYLGMDIYFGWDYHGDYHLKHSKTVYDWLVGLGFESPVDSWDDLTADSGPLTKTINAGGKDVQVEIGLFYGKPGTVTDPDTYSGGKKLEDLMRQSFKEKEVVVFSGHSGPFYGFALANWRKTSEGDLDDSEIPGLDMPSDVYQVVLAEGCETYALGQSFWHNPNKADHTQLDVITTTNFSNASTPNTVKDFVTTLVGTNTKGDHEPRTIGAMLKDMDGNSYWFHTMYGMHGIDDNPHLHPYADVESFCAPCTSSSECGPIGNSCTKLSDDEAFCTAQCTATDGCPDGYECKEVSEGYFIKENRCVPVTGTCTVDLPEPEGPAVIINEVAPNPAYDEAGDYNGDGWRDGTDDEFVELVSASGEPIDISGWTLTDSFTTRMTFPVGTELLPGRALVVFGGGDMAAFGDFQGSDVLVAPLMLGLNNSGDTVTLYDAEGTLVDQVSWDPTLEQGKSLARATDGDPSAAFVEADPTPGVKTTGDHF